MNDVERDAPESGANQPAIEGGGDARGHVPERSAFSSLLLGPTGKVVALGFLVLILLIPTVMVSSLVSERERRAQRVVAEIGSQWGAEQTLTGPLLMVPITRRVTIRDDANANDAANGGRSRTTTVADVAVVRPARLSADMRAVTETRQRSIYEARVYTATVTLDARFENLPLEDLGPDIVSADWSGAFLAVGLDDLSAIENAAVTVDDNEFGAVEPGLGLRTAGGEGGFHTAPIGLTGPPEGLPVTVDMRVRGSRQMAIAPAGLDTVATIAADWPHPSFGARSNARPRPSRAYSAPTTMVEGRLPGEREITEEGFTASWSVPKLSLPVGPAWLAGESGALTPLQRDLMGVRLVEPVDHYARVERTVKYGTLVLIGVFSVAFLIELFAPGAISVVQYLMVGAMIVVFYVLLLAFSEHVAFPLAYVIAAGASGGVLAAFVGMVVGGRRWGLIAGAAFALIFLALYLVLGLEDLALLAGAVFTFALLSTIMFTTRHVDWSGGGEKRLR